MVRAKRIGVWAAAALMLLAFASGTAVADRSPGGAVALQLQGTHGYSLIAFVGARPGQSAGRATIVVEKPRSRVVYGVPATLTASSVEADLGSLGRISMQLQPSGIQRTAHSSCGQQPIRYEAGTWVGELEFRGEEGYASARATRLPFDLAPLLRLVCSHVVEAHSSDNGAVLHLGATGPPPRLSLSARTNGPGKAVEVSATIRERRGWVEIERTVDHRFPSSASAFDYGRDLASASLQPPAPFSGRGVFRRAAAPANRWSGNLRIDFPGRSAVPATGPRLFPVLRRGGRQPAKEVHGRARLVPTLPLWPSTKP